VLNDDAMRSRCFRDVCLDVPLHSINVRFSRVLGHDEFANTAMVKAPNETIEAASLTKKSGAFTRAAFGLP